MGKKQVFEPSLGALILLGACRSALCMKRVCGFVFCRTLREMASLCEVIGWPGGVLGGRYRLLRQGLHLRRRRVPGGLRASAVDRIAVGLTSSNTRVWVILLGPLHLRSLCPALHRCCTPSLACSSVLHDLRAVPRLRRFGQLLPTLVSPRCMRCVTRGRRRWRGRARRRRERLAV